MNHRSARTSVADLAVGDLATDLDDLANDLVANTKREGSVTPASSDGVKIGSANTTSLDGNVDIVLFELLKLELALLEVGPMKQTAVSNLFLLRAFQCVLTTSCGRGS